MSARTTFRIEIFSDTICPWCYIGKRRFEKALERRPEVETEVRWMPFQLNPQMDPAGMDRRQYLESKFGGAPRAEQVYAPIEEAGRGEGIDFRFEAIPRTPNTLRSHRLIHYAHTRPRGQDAIVEALFRSYFERGEDIGDVEVLSGCAAAAGLDPVAAKEYLQSEADAHQVSAQDVMARQMGIQGVPFFVIERRYAVSGAQPPDVFAQIFDRIAEEVAAP